jgi:hypothetical protein
MPFSTGGSRREEDRDGRDGGGFFGGGLRSDILGVVGEAINPLKALYPLERLGIPGVGTIRRIPSVLMTTPLQAALYPRQTLAGGQEMVWGAIEGPYSSFKLIRETGDPFAPARLAARGTAASYQARYGPEWRQAAAEDPLSNIFDLLAVLGPSVRVGAVGAASGRLARAGITRTPKALWRESSRPGLLSAGEVQPRLLTYELDKGRPQTSVQEYSPSPLRRQVQKGLDPISEGFPELPWFGSRARVSRANANRDKRVMERELGSVVGAEALNQLPQEGLTRLFWASQLGDDSTQGLARFRDALKREFDSEPLDADAEFSDAMRTARQLGFGSNLIKRLDKAIEYDSDNTTYRRSWDAMVMATELAESVIKDTHGFTNLINDIKRSEDRLKLDLSKHDRRNEEGNLAQLRAQLKEREAAMARILPDRRARLQEWADANTFADSPQRGAWLNALTDIVGEEKALWLVRLTDGVANTRRPDDPASFYEDLIGMPNPNETAEQFVNRVGDNALFSAPGKRRVFEEGPEGEPPMFYSPLQEEIHRSWPERATVGKYKSLAKSATKEEELYNTGFWEWLDSMPPERTLTKSEINQHLATPLNDYNLEEIHYVNGPMELAPEEGIEMPARYTTQWDKGTYSHGGLLSRDADEGQYHEIVERLYGEGRDVQYLGRGQAHWNMENVVVHVRFHIFEEGGVKKLLVDEIQSDWSNDARRAKAKGIEYKYPSQEEQFEAGLLADKGREIYKRMEEWDEELHELEEHLDWDSHVKTFTEETPLPNDPYTVAKVQQYPLLSPEERARMTARADELDNLVNPLLDELADLDDQIEQLVGHYDQIPPPPLGERHHYAAIRRMAREAADHGFGPGDQIIFSAGATQHFRSEGKGLDPTKTPDTQEIPSIEELKQIERQRREEFGEGDSGYSNTSFFFRLYDEIYPNAFRKEYGIEGEYRTDAYQGRFSAESGRRGKTGDMPGTVFTLTESALEKARGAQRLYQRQPDWDGLPRGATEFLTDRRTRIAMFKETGANESTWIHELGHVLMHDLSPEQQTILSRHYAQGADIVDWKAADHENFNRDWEKWVREGIAPTKALAKVFQLLSKWMREVLRLEDPKGFAAESRATALPGSIEAEAYRVPAEVRAIFEGMFRRDAPRIFVPHRSGAPELTGARTSKGIPRADREIGDQVANRIKMFAPNRLGFMRSGLINDDPRLLMEHVNRVLMLARANQLRESVLNMAEPLMPGDPPNLKRVYVIKRAGSSTDKPFYDALESADNPDEVAKVISDFIDDNFTDNPAEYAAWQGKHQLYQVDKRYVDSLFKNVTGKTPGATTKAVAGPAGQVFDALLDTTRGILLYLNPGFYVSNLLGNSVMMGISDPRALKHMSWSLRNAWKEAAKPGSADADWHRISIEMGRGPTTGTFSQQPAILGRGAPGATPPHLAERIGAGGARMSDVWANWGRRSGRVIDDTFRAMAWRQAATRNGYKTPAAQRKLLEDASKRGKDVDTKAREKARRDLDAIRDQAEQLMLDFDSLTPWERTYAQRAIFLYPFIRASAKYPFMFAGERPLTTAALGQAALAGEEMGTEVLGERPELPAWLKGYARGPGGWWNVGSILPQQMAIDLAESLITTGTPAEIGVNRPFQYINPLLQLAADIARSKNRFGRDATALEILREQTPMPSFWAQALRLREPSEVFEDRKLWETLLRSFRMTPIDLNVEEAERSGHPG